MFHKIRALTLSLVALCALGFTSQANANLYILDATSAYPDAYTSFQLIFNDTGDGIFQFSELESFSGFTYFGLATDTLISSPDIAGISSAFSSGDSFWNFSGSGWYVWVSTSNFTYSLTELASNSVPEPSSVALVGLALAGLVATRRRKS